MTRKKKTHFDVTVVETGDAVHAPLQPDEELIRRAIEKALRPYRLHMDDTEVTATRRRRPTR